MRKMLQSFHTKTTQKGFISCWAFLLFSLFALNVNVFSQSTVNYTFSTVATGSLIDMSSGTTTLLSGAGLDDVSSSVVNIGFPFVLMGGHYTQFSVSSNGSMGLGSTQVPTLGTGTGTTTAPRITPFGGDQGVLTTGGKVHYKVTGSSPNRVLIVEWLNMKMNYTNYATALIGDGTYQALLYESTGKVEFIYGKMNVATTFSTGPVVGISAGTSANQNATIATSTNTKTDGTTLVSNTYVLGDIPNLNSTADGSRRVYTLTPPASGPTAPSGLNFTSVGLTGMTLNWTDNSLDELGFAIFRSDDGGTTYNYIANVAANVLTYNATGLTPGVNYFWEVRAVSEGVAGSPATGSQATSAASFSGTKTIGPSGDYATLTAALADINTLGLAASAVLELQSTYVSTGETFPLNFTNFAGLGASRTLTVRPATGATALSISGTNATAIVQINNGDYVTIDGRPGGSGSNRELTISNAGTGPAILLINDATYNTVKYCNVVGSGNITATSGVILMSTSTATTGNDNNTIDYCDVNALGSACAITSVGTTGKENNDNTISNNNIRNFYISSSSTTSTYGIRVSTASTGFTISGNSLYQEAARAYSATAAIHYGISCSNTSGNNFQITNNHIGGNSPGSVGTYTYSSGSGRFWAMEINVGSTIATSIQGNTIRGFDLSSGFTTAGSTLFGGMVITAGVTNVGNLSGNTIGSTSANSISVSLSGAAAGPIIAGIVTTGGTPHLFQNNTIAGFTVSATTATAYGNLYAISLGSSSGVATVSDNAIGSSSAPINNNSGTGAVTTQYVTAGVRATAGSGTTGITISGNTIHYLNMPAGATNTGATLYGMQLTSSSTVYTVTGNTIKNLTTGSARTSGTTSASLAGINHQGTTSPTVFSGNKVHSLSNTAASAAVVVYGAYLSGTTPGTFQFNSNEVHSLGVASSSTTAVMEGVYIASGAYRIFNNMVRVGIDADGNSVSGNFSISGIRKASSTAQTIVFNSIYVGGSVASSTINTFGFRRTGTSATDSLYNNAIVNARSNSSGAANHYAISTTTVSGLEDNNVFFANGTGGKIGSVDGGTTPQTTLNDYKTAYSGRNALTVAADPKFISSTGNATAVNLHIMPSPTKTPVEALGSAAFNYFTTDFDGQTRSGLTPVDIGADAGDFTPSDVSGPIISYTNLGNSTSTISRNFTNVTITDASNVNVDPGTAPRLYYKKSTNDNVFAGNTDGDNGWKWVESASGSSPFSFEFNYSIIFGGSVTAGDVIQYFVVAQDLATTPNVGINSGVITGTPSSVDLQIENAPITGSIKSFTIVSSITGTVLVGTGQTYESLTADAANGLFKAINDRVVTGNITVRITSDLTESGAVALNQTSEEVLYTIKIVPDDATMKTISGSHATGLIRLNGADRLVFDGRFNETGTASYLTFSNTNATSGSVFQLISQGTGSGATNNTIRNCTIKAGAITATGAYGIHLGSSTLGTAADDNDNNSILNNVIAKAYTGIFAKATATGSNNTLTISGNTIGSSTVADYIGKYGIDLTYTTGSTVSGNTIYNFIGTTSNPTGMLIGTSVLSSSINANKIYQLSYTGTSGFGAKGIDINTGSATSALTISNNLLYNLIGDGWNTFSGDAIVGIRILGTTGGLNIWYNSVNLYGNISRASATTDASAAIYIVNTATNLDIRNNIFANSIENTSGVASAYAIYSDAAKTAFAQINNNIYYATGAEGKLGFLGSAKLTLAEWQAATEKDANSSSSNPTFKANDDLQPFVGSPALAAGTPVTVTTDFTGATRNVTTPSIGAYETGFTPPGVDWANLQWPPTMTLKEGAKGDVYAQVYKAGVTEPAGQGAGISVWIGVNASNTNPNTWTSWTVATFNTQSGNNDEYTAKISGTLPTGTYYYATRVLLEGGVYQYGGYSGGFWDGTTNVSGVLTVEDAAITYANLQSPSTASVSEGGSATIYGRVYVDGVTNIAGASGIVAEIGFNAANTNPSGWTTWAPATFNAQFGNNDEYSGAIGSTLTSGTYYYAYRYKLANDAYYYGGYSGSGGGAWDGTANVSGVLTVNPFVANLPYIQNFDGVTGPALPAGWSILDVNADNFKWTNSASNPRTTPNAMKIGYNSVNTLIAMNDWFFSPGVNLQAGVTYEVSFYYRAESGTFSEKLEVKWGPTANVAGMTSSALFTNTNIVNVTYSKGTATFTPVSAGVYYIGWHGFSDADKFNLYVDDIMVRVNPTATNTQTIAANNTTLFTFTGTGAQVQFTTGNTGSIDLLFEKIGANPLGALPGGLTNLGNTYWTGTVTTGTVNGTYDITLDVTGVEGANTPATIHLLRRSNVNSSWVDEGTPDVVNGMLLTWTGLTSFSDFGLGGLNDNPLPVELVNFTGKAKSRSAILSWETKTEVDNSGFEVERKDKTGVWMKTAFVEGNGTSNSPKYYNFEDKKLASGKHSYRLKQIDNDGSFEYSDEVEVTIDVPTEFAMSQNYPNPFNPSTKVDYQLAENARVTIELYGMTGERVAVLVSEEQEAGYYSMMIDAYKHQLASGIYIYRMIATDALGKNFVATKKLSLIK